MSTTLRFTDCKVRSAKVLGLERWEALRFYDWKDRGPRKDGQR